MDQLESSARAGVARLFVIRSNLMSRAVSHLCTVLRCRYRYERRCALQRSREAEQQKSGECVLCFSRPLQVTYSPCGHVVCCRDCDSALKVNQCPKCREPISMRAPFRWNLDEDVPQ